MSEETDKVRAEFKIILEDFYQNLPETRKKFMTDQRLKEYDITVTRITSDSKPQTPSSLEPHA